MRAMAYVISVFFTFALGAAPFLMEMMVFITFSLQGKQLTAAIVFTTLSLFNVIKLPMAFLPFVLTQLGELSVAMMRIQKFLAYSEIQVWWWHWPCGGTVAWRHGGMAAWRHGGMEAWLYGCVVHCGMWHVLAAGN